jgi:hypothetical protein
MESSNLGETAHGVRGAPCEYKITEQPSVIVFKAAA